MSVSINLRRQHGEWDGVNEYGFDENGGFHPLDIHDDDRVVGLDPGRKYLFTATYGDNKGESVRCSTKEWYSLAGFTRARKKRETWVDHNPTVKGILQCE